MTKGRKFLLAGQILATVLFISHYQANAGQPFLTWLTPLSVLILIVINSIWFTRFTSWLIFAISFFGFLVVLSAFTLRWRLEPGMSAWPFYRAMVMYATCVYISLGQIKILGGAKYGTPKV